MIQNDIVIVDMCIINIFVQKMCTDSRMSASGVVEEGGKGKASPPRLNFLLSKSCRKIFCLSKNVRLQIQNLGLKTPILEKT